MLDSIVPMFFALGLFPKSPCSQEKIEEIISPPLIVDPNDVRTWENTEVQIDCSVTLPENSTVTKMLRFVGSSASNVVFDCGEAAINPDKLLQKKYPSIKVQSAVSSVNGKLVYSRPVNTLIKNCRVNGAVRISSSYYRELPSDDFIGYKNSEGPDYVRQIRASSPARITFDNISVYNDSFENAVYFEQGVTYSTLSNSTVVHDASGVSLYVSAESAFNTIDNNEFHHSSSNKREILALDSTEHNSIINNWFSGANYSAIELYRNCGESGQIRYTGTRHNLIENNILYYSSGYSGDRPGMYIASKNGDGTSSYSCDIDASEPHWDIYHVDPSWGWDSDWESSSTVDYDYARHNTVIYNRFCNREPGEEIVIRNSSFNSPNLVYGNRKIACDNATPIPRK